MRLSSPYPDAAQTDLFELGTTQQQQEDLPQAVEVVEKAPAKQREKGAGRMLLPENLRREVIIIEPERDVTGWTIIEAPLKVLDRDHKNGIHQGYMWIYNAPCDKLTLVEYRKGRDQSGPKQMLAGYQGILQVDSYAAYEKLFSNHPDILLVYCMAHARRKFVDALPYDKQRANHGLGRMQHLYALEEQMRQQQLDWESKTWLRQEKAVPILFELRHWMGEQLPLVMPKSLLGQAIACALPRWEGLSAYALHDQIEIDNNLAENAIRPLAIGRKNFLFAGSNQAAEMTAATYSFMATCKKNGIDERQWLTDVLARIQSHKHKDLYHLLPNDWSKYWK